MGEKRDKATPFIYKIKKKQNSEKKRSKRGPSNEENKESPKCKNQKSWPSEAYRKKDAYGT